MGFELGAAGVDTLEDGDHPFPLAPLPDLLFLTTREVRQPAVGESLALRAARIAALPEPVLLGDDLPDVEQEPPEPIICIDQYLI